MPEPIVSAAEMREQEARTWASGVTEASVIQRAGEAVAEVARRFIPAGAPVLVLAGRGHNGDDALVAGQAMDDRPVTTIRLGEVGTFEAARAWLRERRAGPQPWVIDGLFGIGLNRPLGGVWAALVEALNGSAARVVAVDVPSGLDADTGEVRGAAVEASVTVTLGAVKRGLLAEAAAPWVGRLELAHDIGLAAPAGAPSEEQWTLAEDFRSYPPERPAAGHKGTFGHVAIVAGSLGYHGAAVLAAAGALRARPGLVTVFTDERCYVPVASQLRAAMVRPWSGAGVLGGPWDAVVVGPGLASTGLPAGCREEVIRLWRTAGIPVVADASALDWLSRDLDSGAGLRVLTPHPGEAARLLGRTPAGVQSDRFGAVRSLATGWGTDRVIAVLKGRHTLVARGTGPVFVNSTGGPGLAQGGSGDVLAGLIGGFLARGAGQADPVQAVRYAVWRHGRAADDLDAVGGAWTLDDLLVELGRP